MAAVVLISPDVMKSKLVCGCTSKSFASPKCLFSTGCAHALVPGWSFEAGKPTGSGMEETCWKHK